MRPTYGMVAPVLLLLCMIVRSILQRENNARFKGSILIKLIYTAHKPSALSTPMDTLTNTFLSSLRSSSRTTSNVSVVLDSSTRRNSGKMVTLISVIKKKKIVHFGQHSQCFSYEAENRVSIQKLFHCCTNCLSKFNVSVCNSLKKCQDVSWS